MRKRKHFIFCVFWFCFITTSFAGDYLKLVLAGGDTIYVPAGCVDSLFADSKGKHVYLKIAKEDLDQAVYCNNIDKFKMAYWVENYQSKKSGKFGFCFGLVTGAIIGIILYIFFKTL